MENKLDVLKKMIKDTVKEVFNDQKLSKDIEVKMARATMEDGTVLQYDDNFEIGTPVLIVIDNGEDAEETTEPALEGEYIIPEGTIKVDADGNLSEFVAIEVTDEELEKAEEAEEKPEEKEVELQGLPAEQDGDASLAIEDPNLNLNSLVELLDLNVDGAVELVANIENGVIVSWNLVDVTEMEAVQEEMTANLSKVKEGHNVELSKVKTELEESNSKLELLMKAATPANPDKELGKEKETPLTEMEKRKEAMYKSLNKNK